MNFTIPTVCPTTGSFSAARDAAPKQKIRARQQLRTKILFRIMKCPLSCFLLNDKLTSAKEQRKTASTALFGLISQKFRKKPSCQSGARHYPAAEARLLSPAASIAQEKPLFPPIHRHPDQGALAVLIDRIALAHPVLKEAVGGEARPAGSRTPAPPICPRHRVPGPGVRRRSFAPPTSFLPGD